MKLTIFNGSPRGKNSNSNLITTWFLKSIEDKIDYDLFYLKNVKEHEKYAKELEQSDLVLIIFPLYTDSMPGIVKSFIEKTEYLKSKLNNKSIGYIVHSGFPEAIQSRSVEKYLVRLTEIWGADYVGTTIIPSSEGFKVMPPSMTKKKSELVSQLGLQFISNQKFDNGTLGKLATNERLSPFYLFMFKLFSKTNLTNFYWNQQLKENGVYDQRFARPYEK